MLASMCKQMFLHSKLVTECFFTHITGIQKLASMCKQMFLHIRLVTECSFTHIT